MLDQIVLTRLKSTALVNQEELCSPIHLTPPELGHSNWHI